MALYVGQSFKCLPALMLLPLIRWLVSWLRLLMAILTNHVICTLVLLISVLCSDFTFAHGFPSQASMQSMGIPLWSLSQKAWRPSYLVRCIFLYSESNMGSLLTTLWLMTHFDWMSPSLGVKMAQKNHDYVCSCLSACCLHVQVWAVFGELRDVSGDFQGCFPHRLATPAASHQTPLTMKFAQVISSIHTDTLC